MYKTLLLLLLLPLATINAQTHNEKDVRQAIDDFFEYFHQQDTVTLRAMLADDVQLRSISRNREGDIQMRMQPMDDFLVSLASIPDTLSFQEKLLDYQISIDGDMATAWTPYEFYLGGNFSHCGVNAFQLYHDGSAWRIIALADTRRRAGCKD